MQIIIDTATDTLADINLAAYIVEILKARHGQPRDEKQLEFPPDWLPEMGSDRTEQVHRDIADVLDISVQPASVEVVTPVSPRPAECEDIYATPDSLAAHLHTGPSEGTTTTGVPDPVPSPPASDVAQLPAYLRNRLPEVPSLAVDEDTDTAGVKWDATLHSESRSKCADGTWRKRRTAKNVVVTNVGDTPVVLADVSTLPTELLGTLPAMIPPPPPVAAVPEVPSPPFVPVTTFRELMEQMTIHMASRKVTSKDINAICHEHGIESLQMCFDNTALIPSVHAAIHKIAMKAGV